MYLRPRNGSSRVHYSGQKRHSTDHQNNYGNREPAKHALNSRLLQLVPLPQSAATTKIAFSRSELLIYKNINHKVSDVNYIWRNLPSHFLKYSDSGSKWLKFSCFVQYIWLKECAGACVRVSQRERERSGTSGGSGRLLGRCSEWLAGLTSKSLMKMNL